MHDCVSEIPAINASCGHAYAAGFHSQVVYGFGDKQSTTALAEHRSSFFVFVAHNVSLLTARIRPAALIVFEAYKASAESLEPEMS